MARLKATVKKLMSGQHVAQADLMEIVGGGGADTHDNAGPSEEDEAKYKARREGMTEGNGGGDEA